MSSDLKFLQSLNERELTELVVIPLLEALRYQDIRNTHGLLEHGKDVVCVRRDPLEGDTYVGFTIKAHSLNGSVSSSQSVREVLFQAEQALTEPFLSPVSGDSVKLKQLYILTSGEISQLAVASIQSQLRERQPQVTFVDGPRLLTLLNEHMPGLISSLPDPTKIYLLSLQQRFMNLTTPVSLGSQREFRLPEIYTAGGLTETSAAEAAFISFADLNLKNSGLVPVSVYRELRFLVLIADVGAGKTTMLKKLTLDLLSEEERQGDGPAERLIPIYIELATLPKTAVGSFYAFQSWLQERIDDLIRGRTSRTGEADEYLLLLDGFDEVPQGHEALEAYLRRISTDCPKGIIVTSRPTRIPNLETTFSYFRLDPFSRDDIELFLQRWFRDDVRVDELMDRIDTDSTLFGFCRTPLLLTLYAVLAASDSVDRLPSRRTEIYESLSNLLLGRWDSMRRVTNQFTPGLKSYVLEQLAFSIHKRGRKSFQREDLIGVAVPLLGESPKDAEGVRGRDSRRKSSLLFDELIFRSSLIRRAESEDWTFSRPSTQEFAFAHLSFQEYFCSRHLLRSGDRKTVERMLYTDWWKNTIAFYFGSTRSMDGIRVSTKRGVERGYVLVEYLAEADYTSQEQREAIFRIVATQLMSMNQPPGTVVEACKRIGRELIDAMEKVLTASGQMTHSWINYAGFFELSLQMGHDGLLAALRQSWRLEDYPASFISHLIAKSVRFINFPQGTDLLKEALNALGGPAAKKLSRQSQQERLEVLRIVHRNLHEAILAISADSYLDARRQSVLIEAIKSAQRRLVGKQAIVIDYKGEGGANARADG